MQPNASRDDILTLLMSARDEAGEALTDAELRDELMTLLVAGHETTATALTWALYWIHKFPKVHERVLAELQTVDPSDPSAVSRLQLSPTIFRLRISYRNGKNVHT
jgi:cytochrome P450